MDYDHFKFQNTSYFSYYFKNAKIGLAFRLIICWLGFPETGKINVSDKGNYFFCIVTNKRVQIRDGFTIWSYFWKAECKEFTNFLFMFFFSSKVCRLDLFLILAHTNKKKTEHQVLYLQVMKYKDHRL